MSRILIALAIAATAACSGTFGGPATRHHSSTLVDVAYATSVALTVCDSGGTIWASHGGRWDRMSRPGYRIAEVNPVLGHEPSIPLLMTGVAVATMVGYVVREADLPTWVKLSWFGAVTGVEGFAVAQNVQYLGACGVVGQRRAGFDTAVRQ